MDDFVKLHRQLRVECGNRPVDRARQIAIERDRAGERLFDQRFNQILGAIGLGLLGCGDDLFEQPAGRRGVRRCRRATWRKVQVGNGSALLLIEPQFARQ
jgi:hypothetical protein